MLELARRFHWPLLILDLVIAAVVGLLATVVTGEPAWLTPALMALLGVLNALVAKTDRDFAREVNAAAFELGEIAPGTDIAKIAAAVAALLTAPPFTVAKVSGAPPQAFLLADGSWDVYDQQTGLTHHQVSEEAVVLLFGQGFVDRVRAR